VGKGGATCIIDVMTDKAVFFIQHKGALPIAHYQRCSALPHGNAATKCRPMARRHGYTAWQMQMHCHARFMLILAGCWHSLIDILLMLYIL